MKIKILAFGIAKDILQTNTLEREAVEGLTVGALKEDLMQQYAEFQRLKSLSLAVNEEYRSDDYIIEAGDEVVLIPPVSGG